MEPQSPPNMMLGHHQHQGNAMVNTDHFNLLEGHHGYYPGHAHAHPQIHNRGPMEWDGSPTQFYPPELRYATQQNPQNQLHHHHHQAAEFSSNVRRNERSKEGRSESER